MKTQSKESPKGMDIISNYIFLSLKNHKGVTIIWIVNFFLEYASLLAKFQCSRLDANQKSFCALMIEITKEIEIGGKKNYNTF
jgi:hypothetical protein